VAEYVLVHGGQRDGSLWDEVVPLLQAEGNRTFAPSLSRPDGSTLSEHISEICGLLEEHELDAIVLVGHSYASFVITGVAERMPERIKRLIYVDCAVPHDGKSLYGMFEDLGITSEEYGLPQDPPFLEPLHFDEERIRRIHKTYIHCTQSEFLAIGKPAFEEVKGNAERDNWDYFEIDSNHAVMISHPKELSAILLEEQD
jgi:pimeloyl-ACP methyl ester carboxylesterase